jgi:hypothetical protein
MGRYFTLDPNFPSRLLRSGHNATINFVSFLFEEYSNRNLTFPTDRCVAISGLEKRIADALEVSADMASSKFTFIELSYGRYLAKT